LGPEVLGVPPLFESSAPVYEDDGVTVSYLNWSGPTVQPEEVVNYEAGTAIRTGSFVLTVNGYWMDSRNEIVPFGGIYLGYAIKGNAEKTWHRGIELDLRTQLRRHTFIVAASRSWDRYERFIYHENVYDEDGNQVGVIERDYSGNPIALFPQYLGSVIWRADWSALQSMVRYRVVGKQYLDNTGLEERTIDPYYVWDLGLTMDLGRLFWQELSGAKLRLLARNLLDAEYETNGYYDDWYLVNRKIPGAERNYWIGLEYDF
jgi:iron complex outermembrane receptor protein